MRLILLFLCLIAVSPSFSQSSKAPKLVVGIVIDQMSYDYLNRFYDRFGKNGFRKLMDKGVNCRNVNYNYVPTYTGPGHASIYTGTTPSLHGIIANEWIDRNNNFLLTNCVSDSTVKTIGSESLYGICSPKNLIAQTFTDELKLHNPNSKVISLSIKDRAAILPGGHMSNGSFWYDYESGKMISSSFYMEALPQWIIDFNAQNRVETSMQQTWNTLYPIETYQYADNNNYEKPFPGKDQPVFPYNLKEMSGNKINYALFTGTPFANTFLADLSIEALKRENLGKGKQTDALCISFSTPDIAGHSYGPNSVEIEDMYLRLDIEIAKIIKALEDEIGKDNFVLFLTADHAVVQVPQFLVDNKLPGGYVYLSEKTELLTQKLKKNFGENFDLFEENNNIYLKDAGNVADPAKIETIEKFLANEIATWEGVNKVYTSKELSNLGTDNLDKMVRQGYMPYRNGNIVFTLDPGFLPKGKESSTSHQGTSHGSAYGYDTHVPLLFYGNKLKAGEIFERIEITDIAATITQMLYLPNTNCLTGSPILPLLKR